MNAPHIVPARVPSICYWEITRACNHRCIHCINSAGKKKEAELTAAKALALCDEMAELGVENINLTGGEPLLRDDWSEIARRLSALGVEVVIVTNGLLVDEELVERMIECGVSAVAVSLDGDAQTHNAVRRLRSKSPITSFDAAIRAVELAAASSMRAAVITQVHRGNMQTLQWIHERLVPLKLDAWQIQAAIPFGRLLEISHQYLLQPDDLPALIEQLADFIDRGQLPIQVADNIGYYCRHEPKLRITDSGRPSFWRGCQAGISVVAIDPTGNVKGCPSQPEEFAAQNVRRSSLADIWSDPSNFPYNTQWDENLLEGECAVCSFKRICRAGCKSMAFSTTGTIYDNPFCVQRSANR